MAVCRTGCGAHRLRRAANLAAWQCVGQDAELIASGAQQACHCGNVLMTAVALQQTGG